MASYSDEDADEAESKPVITSNMTIQLGLIEGLPTSEDEIAADAADAARKLYRASLLGKHVKTREALALATLTMLS